MQRKTYNGYKNWTHWNVSLWINNDEGLYLHARELIRGDKLPRKAAAKRMLQNLHDMGITHTPDGARYSAASIYSAMEGM